MDDLVPELDHLLVQLKRVSSCEKIQEHESTELALGLIHDGLPGDGELIVDDSAPKTYDPYVEFKEPLQRYGHRRDGLAIVAIKDGHTGHLGEDLELLLLQREAVVVALLASEADNAVVGEVHERPHRLFERIALHRALHT